MCHPTKGDVYSSLISRVRLHLGPESRPHLINRLDRETSGVTLIAKNDIAARELRVLMESRLVQKEYLAIVHGHVREDHGIIDAPLGKDTQSRIAIKDCVRADGAPSRTEYWVVARLAGGGGGCGQWAVDGRQDHRTTGLRDHGTTENKQARAQCDLLTTDITQQPATLLRIQPHTGRKHQIRIHLAHIGHPIVGDKIYGGDEDLYLALVENRLTSEQRSRLILEHHALHASRLAFEWREQACAFAADPDSSFRLFWTGHRSQT